MVTTGQHRSGGRESKTEHNDTDSGGTSCNSVATGTFGTVNFSTVTDVVLCTMFTDLLL